MTDVTQVTSVDLIAREDPDRRGQRGARRDPRRHRGEVALRRRGWPSRSSSLAADAGITGCTSSAAIAHHLQRRVEHGAEAVLVGVASDLRSTHGSCAEKYRLAAPSISQIASSAWCIACTSNARPHPRPAGRRRAPAVRASSAVNSPGVGHHPVEVLGHHRQRPLRQVAELVGEVGVDPADDGVFAVAAVLAERHLAQEEVAHLIDAELRRRGRSGRPRCRPTCSSSRP